MSSPRDRRIDEDINRLRRLRDEHADLVQKISVSGNPVSLIRVTLGVPTAGDQRYPVAIQDSSRVQIELLSGYPLVEPKVSSLCNIWNPNVFPSGLVCLGRKWIATEGLDLLVLRVLRLLAFDPSVINTASPANREASNWYVEAKRRHPNAFPTIQLDRLLTVQHKPSIQWKNIV